ncbi:hypothetical protein MJO28_010163 [Puccinia striiformis f. sp. tritici]|uniref:Uncharacterized protein n=1 Tax=Puccinia striiformis f. sp. tritici TaxID=168172 RepID=A0ACC0E6R2_9BASI|nr:hypothetical protein MJO28_010163 [Puccinia striiformis f. sp. tritici]
MALPTDTAEIINAEIGAKKSWSGQYTVDCGRIPELPDLTFNFGGKEFTITGEDYILQVQGTCISAFTGLDMPPNIGELWIIVNDSSFASLPGPSEPNGGLLTDPLHSNSGSFPVGVPIAKPSVLVTSALLTAAPATATARSNSSIDSDNSKNKQNQGYNNTMAQHPVLSGSMAISLPTPVTPYIPPQATQPPSPASGVATSSSPSPTTVLEVVTAGEVMPTPTTSTTYVYATNSPTSPGSASPPPSSSGHYLSPSCLSSLAGLGMSFILVVQLFCV